MSKVGEWAKENKNLLLKSGIFAGASFLDYYLTDLGIAKGRIEEVHPVVSSYLSMYGNMGPYLLKGIMTAGGIFGMYLTDKNPEKTRYTSNHVFCIGTGAYFTASAACLYHILR